jgi:hypothetical protein
MLVVVAPYLMRFLAIFGTAAMFLVGGGIVVHGIPPFHHWVEHLIEPLTHWHVVGGVLHWLAEACVNLGVGVGAGAIIVVLQQVGQALLFKKSDSH